MAIAAGLCRQRCCWALLAALLLGFVGSVAAGGYMIVEAVEGPPGGEEGSTGFILSAKVANKNADSKFSAFIAVKIC